MKRLIPLLLFLLLLCSAACAENAACYVLRDASRDCAEVLFDTDAVACYGILGVQEIVCPVSVDGAEPQDVCLVKVVYPFLIAVDANGQPVGGWFELENAPLLFAQYNALNGLPVSAAAHGAAPMLAMTITNENVAEVRVQGGAFLLTYAEKVEAGGASFIDLSLPYDFVAELTPTAWEALVFE